MNTVIRKPINLATKKGRKDVCNCESLQNLYTFASLENFITKNEIHVVYKESIFLCYNHMYFILSKGVLYDTDAHSFQTIVEELEDNNDFEVLEGVYGVVVKEKFMNSHHLFIANADAEYNDLAEFAGENDFPSLSFSCLNRFFEKEEVADTVERIASGKLKVLDVSLDSRIPMSPGELSEFQKVIKEQSVYNTKPRYYVKPPCSGYTAIYPGVWHRPATILFYDKVKERTLLFGQDEGSYFGCDVPNNPKTIVEAFDYLVPEKLRNRLDVVRQGEWFLAPMLEESLPPYEQALVTTKDFNLPIEHALSNYHNVTCTEALIFKTGEIYAKDAHVRHDEHEEVYMEGWCSFHRNLAKQSFSEQGVD